MSLFGPPNIEKMKARRDVKGLIKALHYRAESKQQEDQNLRRAATEALGELKDLHAVEPLIAALKDEALRDNAATALGKIGDARAMGPLLEILPVMGGCVAKALKEIGWKPTRDVMGAYFWIARRDFDQCVKIGEPAVEPLVEALNSREPRVCAAVSQALGKIGAVRAVRPLIDTIKHDAYEVRKAVIVALGQLGDPGAVESILSVVKPRKSGQQKEIIDIQPTVVKAITDIGSAAVEPLIAALQEKSQYVPKVVIEALGQIGDARAVEPLITALQHTDANIRKAAAEALGMIGDARAVEPLIAGLKDSKGDVRYKAAIALGRIGDARAMEPLIAALKDTDQAVCKVAAGALEKMDWEPGKNEEGARYWVALRQWEECGEIGAPAVESLIPALKDKDDYVSRVTAETLGKIGDARAVEPLVAVLQHTDANVRSVAAEALGKIGDARAVEPLIAALRDTEKHVRQAAAGALVKIGVPAVEALVAALQDGNENVREATVDTLDQLRWKPGKDVNGACYWIAKGKVGNCVSIGAPAVEPLVAALKNQDDSVRKSAAEALKKIGWQPTRDEAGAAYWIARRNWNQCAAMGAPAVQPLIAALKDEDFNVRLDSEKALRKIADPHAVKPLIAALDGADMSLRRILAQSLVSLYETGELDYTDRQTILAHQRQINLPHEDGYEEGDIKQDCTRERWHYDIPAVEL